jgi:hypothetical protein
MCHRNNLNTHFLREGVSVSLDRFGFREDILRVGEN